MREEVTQMLRSLSTEEREQIVRELLPDLVKGLREERAILNKEGSTVGYFLPTAFWLAYRPESTEPEGTEEEVLRAAKDCPTLKDVLASLPQ